MTRSLNLVARLASIIRSIRRRRSDSKGPAAIAARRTNTTPENPLNEPFGGVRGALDGIRDGELFGWAYNTAQGSAPELVTIDVNGKPVTTVAAVHARQDVTDAIGSPVQVGFYVDLSKHTALQEGTPVEVNAHFADGTFLTDAPRTLTLPKPAGKSHTKTVLFMHIPKTAGTAFRECIAANYLHSEIAYIYPTTPGFPVSDLHGLPLGQRRSFRVVIGHYLFGMHHCLPQESEYITVVRHPASRTVSQYAYLQQVHPDLLQRQNGGIVSLPEMLKDRLTVDFDNPMVRCFSGIGEGNLPPGSIDGSVLRQAIANLRNSYAYVGHQEDSARAMTDLQKRYSWTAKNTLGLVNRTTVAVRERSLDWATTQAIEHFCRWDYLLYNEILRLFPRSEPNTMAAGASA